MSITSGRRSARLAVSRRAIAGTATCLVLLGSAVIADGASAAKAQPTPAQNCVIETHGIDAQGNFIADPMECYATFEESLRAGGVDDVPEGATIEEDGPALANVANGIIGVHYDGLSGTGPAMTVTGNVCGGGGLNVPGPWNDIISSTYNGCPTIVHWENGGYTGATGVSFGIGNITNLGAMDNRTTSIRYYG